MKYIIATLSILIYSQIFAIHIFSELDLNKPSIEVSELRQYIKDHAAKPSSILSLGESHLQNDTTLPIQIDMMNLFANEKPSFYLCAEHIGQVVKSNAFIALGKKAKKTIISHGNNPYKTDFIKCNKKKKSSRIYYSGFFHQYPFANYFPRQFPQLPVITERDNNIWEQNQKKGMYITQSEMIFMEMGITNSILNSPYSDFETNLEDSLNSIEQLQKQMIKLNQSHSPYTQKLGYITKASDLFTHKKNRIPENAYIIFTELAYRIGGSHLHLLEKLKGIKPSLVQSIFNLPPKQKYFTSSLQTLSKAATKEDSSGYGTMPFRFEHGSQFFHFKNKGYSVLLVSQPSKAGLDIINAKTKKYTDINFLEQAL